MGKKARYLYLVLLVVLTGYGCKKVINVDLNNAAPQLVIEGEVSSTPGSARVRISRSVAFAASNNYPPVSGAMVRIVDTTNGIGAVLSETDSGFYTTRLVVGVTHHTYVLQVTVDGKSYTSSSTMPEAVPIDSITFAVNTDFNNNKDINAVVNFSDPSGLGNYYQFTESIAGRAIPNIFVFEDRLSDGRYIRQPLFNDSSYLQKGDTLVVTMNNVDKNVYEYFFTLASVTGSNSFQSATPANPITNISNGALGYFSAHTTFPTKVEIY